MNENEETVLTKEHEKANAQDEGKMVLENEPAVGNDAVEEDIKKKKHSTARNISMGAVGGIALGSTGTLLSGASIEHPILNNETDVQEVATDHVTSPVVSEEIHFATNIDDSMSFNEAFAAARHEVGAGGAFVWHGTVYGTYYGNEWESMTSDEQSQFTHDAIGAYRHQNDDPDDHTGHEVTSTSTNASTITHLNSQELATSTEEIYDANIDGDQENTIEVHVLGHEEGVFLDNGSEANIGIAEVGGETALFIDVVDVNGNDGPDGVYDVVVMDSNGDAVIDENEVAFVDPNSGMTVDSFDAAMQMENPLDDVYSSMPDYTNDADVSSLC